MKSTLFGVLVCMMLNTSSLFSQSYDQQEFKEAFIAFSSSLNDDFISQLEELPDDFEPENLGDFKPYLPNDFDITAVETTFNNCLDYVSSYERVNNIDDISQLYEQVFDDDLDAAEALPCYNNWLQEELQITAALVVCCFSGIGCPACIAAATVAYGVNLYVFYNCVG